MPERRERGPVGASPVPGLTRDGTRRPSLARLRAAAADCRACELWKRGTQTVWGAGAAHAALMLVGEQPGDEEDLSGKPFVGPAGRLLDRALEAAAVDRRRVYVTNAVKHFNWRPVGKRRIHERPGARAIAACRPWLLAEIEAVRPRVVVCMGATAARTVLGPDVRVTRDRGRPLASPIAPHVIATVHPSAVLRAPDEETRRLEMERFIADLRAAARCAR